MTETPPSVSSMPKEAKKGGFPFRIPALRCGSWSPPARGEETGPARNGLLKVLTKDVLEIARVGVPACGR